MFTYLFIKGWLIGFSIAMPVGPIGLLCIRNSLRYGMICGLITGLGAASADTVYGAIAGFGLNAVSDFLTHYRSFLQCLGGLFLLYLGSVIFLSKPQINNKIELQSHSKVFLTTFFLTLANPMTILSFAGIYVGLGATDHTLLQILLLTLGVFIGSTLWWLMLSFLTAFFKEKLSSQIMLWLNKLSGCLILFFGLLALYQIL